jgi:hypothetical protein
MFKSLRMRNKSRATPELQDALEQALCRHDSGTANSLLQMIADATQEEDTRHHVLGEIWRILDSKKDQTRRIVKALDLIEVLLKRGCSGVVEDIRAERWRIGEFTDYQSTDSGRDVASGVRYKAQNILTLLQDSSLLSQERKRNEQIYKRMQGVGLQSNVQTEGEQLPKHEKGKFWKQVKKMAWRKKGTEWTGQDDDEWSREDNLDGEDFRVQGVPAFGNSSRGQDSSNRAGKVGFLEKRLRCEQLRSILPHVSELQAEELLRKTSWDVSDAIDIGMKSLPKQLPSAASTAHPSSESDSGSSDGSETDDDSKEDQLKYGRGSAFPPVNAAPRTQSTSFGGGWDTWRMPSHSAADSKSASGFGSGLEGWTPTSMNADVRRSWPQHWPDTVANGDFGNGAGTGGSFGVTRNTWSPSTSIATGKGGAANHGEQPAQMSWGKGSASVPHSQNQNFGGTPTFQERQQPHSFGGGFGGVHPTLRGSSHNTGNQWGSANEDYGGKRSGRPADFGAAPTNPFSTSTRNFTGRPSGAGQQGGSQGGSMCNGNWGSQANWQRGTASRPYAGSSPAW